MSKHRETTVTAGAWGVSTTTGSGIEGAILHVYRHLDLPVRPGQRDKRGRFVAGPTRFVTWAAEGNGRSFESSDAAFAWAREHGYLEVYRRRVWCRKHRALHTFMGKPTPTFRPDACDGVDIP